MKFSIFTADCAGNPANCLYPHEKSIASADELCLAIKKDQVFAKYHQDYRSIDNFIRSDVIPMDVDNDHSDVPKDWVSMEDLSQALPDIQHVIFPSRNHMKPKGGKSARPRFHVLFPISVIDDVAMYSAIKTAIGNRYDFFDDNAKDAARFFYASDCKATDVIWNEGFLSIEEVLDSSDYVYELYEKAEKDDPCGGIILEGSRNNTLSRFAARILKRYGVCDRAYQMFLERAGHCEPPLPDAELQSIWNSALKFYSHVRNQDGYVSPDEFNRDFASLKPEDYSDLGEAKVFKGEYENELRYTKATDYLRHDGVCWREEPQLALGAAEEFLDLQYADAIEAVEIAEKALVGLGIDEAMVKSRDKALGEAIPKDKMYLLGALLGADAYLKFVLRYRNYRNIQNVLSAAKPMLAMDISDFDKDPNMLNTPGGTFDLEKGMDGMHAHDFSDFITKVTNVSPGNKGKALWDDAIKLFFCDDDELIDYVQAQVGMAAIGKVYQERLIIAYGGGANGKSTFWNTIAKVLGSYSGKISAEALTMSSKRNVKPEMAELKGKRLIIASELQEGMSLNSGMVKALCSVDPIQAEKKYRDPFHFDPSHTLVLYTNHLPKVRANDDGTWRRLIVIPFNARITGSSDKKNYAEKLYEEAGPSIMAWIIEGAKKAIDSDFRSDMPSVVKEAIDRYREENDWFSHFIEECCDVDASYTERSGELYRRFCDYCRENGEFIKSTNDFYAALSRAGFERVKKKSGMVIIGLRIKKENDFVD